MEFTLTEYALAIGGGFIAGIMNTLAGYGSVITLTILMDIIGLPATVANATNRVNVFTGVAASGVAFYKNGKLDPSKGKAIIIMTTIGAIIGIYLATQVSNEQFRFIFKILVVVLFFTLLAKPKRWLKDGQDIAKLPLWLTALIFIPIGIYGGFIQMGMGLIFVAATVLISKYDIVSSNALKVMAVMLYTIFSLIIFQYNGLIEWKAGLLIGIGAASGGYAAAHFSSRYKNAPLWTYRFLMLVVIIIIIRTFGIFG